MNPVISKAQVTYTTGSTTNPNTTIGIELLTVNNVQAHLYTPAYVSYASSPYTSAISYSQAAVSVIAGGALTTFKTAVAKMAMLGVTCMKAGTRQFQMFQVVFYNSTAGSWPGATISLATDSYGAPVIPQQKSVLFDYANQRFQVNAYDLDPDG